MVTILRKQATTYNYAQLQLQRQLTKSALYSNLLMHFVRLQKSALYSNLLTHFVCRLRICVNSYGSQQHPAADVKFPYHLTEFNFSQATPWANKQNSVATMK